MRRPAPTKCLTHWTLNNSMSWHPYLVLYAAARRGLVSQDIKIFHVQRVERVVGPGRRVCPSTVATNDYRRRVPPELKPGMQRPFRLRKAYGATGRLGAATMLRKPQTFVAFVIFCKKTPSSSLLCSLRSFAANSVSCNNLGAVPTGAAVRWSTIRIQD
jgi:hypothetical protein